MDGTAVGSGVGTAEGDGLLGTAVEGSRVGVSVVGPSVGESVGRKLGSTVGKLVGPASSWVNLHCERAYLEQLTSAPRRHLRGWDG